MLFRSIEEVSKFLATSTAADEPSFDEPMDGLVYAVTAALGFALVENLTYALTFGAGTATGHALLATLGHALFSAPQGYALGGHWTRIGRWWRRRGLALSIALHFVFNGVLTGSAGWPLLIALASVVVLMTLLAGRYYLNYEKQARTLEQGEAPPRSFPRWPGRTGER